MKSNILKKIKEKILRLKSIPCFYCVVLFIIFIGYIFYDASNHPTEIKIAVGKKTGAYYVYAKKYKEKLKKYNVDLKIITSNGSLDTQKWLIEDKVDFAFIQGGFEKTDVGILALANVAYEPIWVLCKKDSNITNFKDLKGKKVNICNPSSGTAPVASKMLKELLGMDKKELKTFHANKAFEKLLNNEIDAMFYIIARSSTSLQDKIKNKNIKIMNFEDSAESIQKYFIKNDMNLSQNSNFRIVTLKKGSISFMNDIPKKDKVLLAKQTILATKNASNSMVRLFLKVAKEVHSKEGFFYKEGYFLNTESLRYKQHPASKIYFEKPMHRYELNPLDLNFWLAQSLKEIEDAILIFIVPLTILGFIIEVIYPSIKMITRRKISRWYRRVNMLDTGMGALSIDELNSKVIELKGILIEIQDTDNIDSVHLESFYSLQHQINSMIYNFEKRIEGLKKRQNRE